MPSSRHSLYIAVLAFLLATGTEASILSASSSVIEVSKSVTFNCSSVMFVADGVRFYVNQPGTRSHIINFVSVDTECFGIGISVLPFNVSFSCVNSTLFSIEIHNVRMDFHNSSVSCEVYNSNNVSKSAETILQVAVPVKGTDIAGFDESSVLTTIESIVSSLTCTTTASYPAPHVTWYRLNWSSNAVEIDAENVVLTEKYEHYHLITMESKLMLNVSRGFNGTRIYCTASNGFGDEPVVSSSPLQVIVQYPPSKPEVSVGAVVIERNINVIKEKALSISCSSDGYPAPSFFWIHKGNVCSTIKLLTINATNESHKGTYVCKVNNTMKWNTVGESKKEIFLTILIPPSRPIFHFNGSSENVINGTMYVVKNDSFTVICKSVGVPTPVCAWNESLVNSDILTELLVQTDFVRVCYASSEIAETVGENKSISVKSTLDVEVLFPPRTPTIQLHTYSEYPQNVINNVTIEEFSSFNLTCAAVSKPDVDIYTWSGQENSSSNKVILESISRHKCGLYTCHASNKMQRSFGKEEIGQFSKTVFVDILYASEVTEFVVDGKKEDKPAVITQRENATIVCSVDSNPSSSIDVHFKDKLLANGKDTKRLIHVLKNISCDSAGIYYCYSSNRINYGNRSKQQLLLIVKCPPLPEQDLNFNVTTMKYVSATLRFKAMDYLDLNNTTFTWQRENNASQWETVKHDTKGVKVSTFNLQTNLTVVNVTGNFSGIYRVVYNNSVGGNTQLFQLSVADLPDKPTSFDYLKESLTSTQVTVVWTKGYGGGLRQTFLLNISQRSQPIKYDYINETGNEDMQHTITGLSGGTQYKLTLWATNVLGKSLSQTLTIFTKESETKETSSLTAAITGSVSSLVAVIAGVSVAFLLYKRRHQTKSDKSNGERSFDDGSEINEEFGSNNPSNNKREPVYEGLKAINERGNVEMKEQTYDILKYEQDSSETKDPVYTNLKL